LANVGNVAQNGVTTDNQLVYRARLGWSKDSWSVTGFVNYSSHFYHTQQAPPNVNGQCVSAGKQRRRRHLPLRDRGLQQCRAFLLHLRSFTRIQHRRYPSKRLSPQYRRAGRDTESVRQSSALWLPRKRRRRFGL
jgi:hypothetical protein